MPSIYFKKSNKKCTKYLNKIVELNGEKFHSIKEMEHYKKLLIRQKLGEISNLTRQSKWELIPSQYQYFESIKNGKSTTKQKLIERSVHYYADFEYIENGELKVVDTKGIRTKDFIIKRKLMLHVHKIKIIEV